MHPCLQLIALHVSAVAVWHSVACPAHPSWCALHLSADPHLPTPLPHCAGNALGLIGVGTGLAATLGAVSQTSGDPMVLAQVRAGAADSVADTCGSASWVGKACSQTDHP